MIRSTNALYTFVIDFLGGTYVRQARGNSPERALRSWLRLAGEHEISWSSYRPELMRALIDQSAVPIDGCENVWCMSGLAGDHLFLIHIIGSESGATLGQRLADAQQIGAEFRRLGRGEHW
jgi:hypothetical protein